MYIGVGDMHRVLPSGPQPVAPPPVRPLSLEALGSVFSTWEPTFFSDCAEDPCLLVGPGARKWGAQSPGSDTGIRGAWAPLSSTL